MSNPTLNTTKPVEYCGQCEHWSVAKGYAWGTCLVPIPTWADSNPSPIIYGEDKRASDCPCFKETKLP